MRSWLNRVLAFSLERLLEGKQKASITDDDKRAIDKIKCDVQG